MTDSSNFKYNRACRGEEMNIPPVWLMRQAGRYLPEYRDMRAKHEFLEICRNPEIACEVTLQPIRRFGFDASILFSDILIPLVPMGANLTFGEGEGPKIDPPIRTIKDIDSLKLIDPREDLSFVLDAITMIRRELPDDVALIGFAGAPFTLATYLIEGGKPNPFANIKKLMYSEPAAFKSLLEKLGVMVADYMKAMVDAGVNAIQIFDTWGGILSSHDFRSVNLPIAQKIFLGLHELDVPLTYFVHNGTHLLTEIKDSGCNVASLDWRCPIPVAREILGQNIAIQGNLDPTVLLGSENGIRKATRRVIDSARGSGGHIFNFGHGILPMTPISSVEIMLDEIRGGRE